MSTNRRVTKTIQFFIPEQVAEGMPQLSSKLLREGLAKLNLESAKLQTALGDVRIKDKTPQDVESAHLVLWLSRHEILTLEKDGKESIPNIDDATSFLEKTHLIFVDDKNIALLFNQSGPKPKDFTNFLMDFLPGLGKIALRPLVSENTATRIKNLNTVTYMKFKVQKRMAYFTDPATAPGITNFRQGMEALHADQFTVEIKGGSDPTFTEKAKILINRIASAESMQDVVSAFEIKGRSQTSNRVQPINLFSDKLFIRKQIDLGKERRVTDERAFKILMDSYTTLSKEIEKSETLEAEEKFDDIFASITDPS